MILQFKFIGMYINSFESPKKIIKSCNFTILIHWHVHKFI